MKAPDKIYVAKTTFPEYVDWEGSPINTKEVSDNDICYIRKDALMEWANKQKEEAEFRYNQADMNFVREVAFDDLIDKLNSM